MQMRKQPCICHLHIQLVCPPPPTLPDAPPPNFAKSLYPISPGSYSLSKRNWRQCVCRILRGKRGVLWEMCKWRISCYNSSILFPGFSGTRLPVLVLVDESLGKEPLEQGLLRTTVIIDLILHTFSVSSFKARMVITQTALRHLHF